MEQKNKTKQKHAVTGLTPEFKQWLDDVVTKEGDVIKALAKK